MPRITPLQHLGTPCSSWLEFSCTCSRSASIGLQTSRSPGTRTPRYCTLSLGTVEVIINYYSLDIGTGWTTGTGETRLTDTGYSQGVAIWSHSGDKLVYVVAAIGSAGKYDIYMMDSDGSNARNITPDYFPASFLCHSAMFSKDDSKVYFTGQWWT